MIYKKAVLETAFLCPPLSHPTPSLKHRVEQSQNGLLKSLSSQSNQSKPIINDLENL